MKRSFERSEFMKFTRRFILKSLENITLSSPIRYERYYVNDYLRIQRKDNYYHQEILNDKNEIVQKNNISKKDFIKLKETAHSKIIRDSYLYLKDNRISIKKYYDEYEGLNRIEVKFQTKDEMEKFEKEPWFGSEITLSPLAFDKDLSKLSKEEFLQEIKKYL